MQICEMGRSLVEVWHSQGVVRLRFPKKIWIIVIGLVALCTNKFIFFHLTGSWTNGRTDGPLRPKEFSGSYLGWIVVGRVHGVGVPGKKNVLLIEPSFVCPHQLASKAAWDPE